MVGLLYLKHAYDESDESVVARWVENPYWQHLRNAGVSFLVLYDKDGTKRTNCPASNPRKAICRSHANISNSVLASARSGVVNPSLKLP